MKKNIKDIFKKWGNESQELPARDSVLKEEILSKIPFSVSEYRRKEKKSVLPYFSLAFVGIAALFLVVNLFPKENNNFAKNDALNTPKQVAKVLKNEKKESSIVSSVRRRIEEDKNKIARVEKQTDNTVTTGPSYPDYNSVSGGMSTTTTTSMPSLSSPSASTSSPVPQYNESAGKTQNVTIFPDLGVGQVPINDTREFLKINYSANLKTRNVNETVKNVEDVARTSNGRVDGSSDREGSSYVRFSVPAEKFEDFRNQIKGLVNIHLFTEEKSVTNMLSKKQDIEAGQNSTQTKINEIKSRKNKIVKNHNEITESFDEQLVSLEIEVRNLKIQYQTAKPAIKGVILARLAQITNQENAILLDYDAEDADFNVKVSVVNKELESAGATLDEINAQDVSFMQDIATVNGTIYIEHVNIYEFADAYIPGPLIAWVLILLAGILYIRYRILQLTIEI